MYQYDNNIQYGYKSYMSYFEYVEKLQEFPTKKL
jgi:hypothetical protein